MVELFGDPSWHKVVNRPGVWAWSRVEGWQEMKQDKVEETVTTTDFDMNRTFADQVAKAHEATEVNVGVGGQEAKAALDAIADKVRYYDQLTEAINKAQADRLKVQDEIKAAMGAAQVATVGGVPTFTYAAKETWRTTDIKRDMPHLVAQYVVTQEVEVVNWGKFMEHHRDAVKEYQTREFRRVSGTRATRG